MIDVLAALPPDELARMRQKNQRDLARARTEVAKLELQEQQFDAALAKRERKKPGRPGALNPEVVFEAAQETSSPMTAADVRGTLASRGLEVSTNAVRNHLNRLVETGDLEKDEHKKYVLPTTVYAPTEFVPSADDDIPF